MPAVAVGGSSFTIKRQFNSTQIAIFCNPETLTSSSESTVQFIATDSRHCLLFPLPSSAAIVGYRYNNIRAGNVELHTEEEATKEARGDQGTGNWIRNDKWSMQVAKLALESLLNWNREQDWTNQTSTQPPTNICTLCLEYPSPSILPSSCLLKVTL